MKNKAFAALFLGILCLSLLLRVPQLGLRPMHHDEANQAVKFGDLLERGEYRYDRTDHHGPSLYYLTLPFAWASGASSLAELNEATVRSVPVAFGVLLLLLLLMLQQEMGKGPLLLSGVFLAVSPAVVFYNRFYIQESLFIFFILGTLAAAWRYYKTPSWIWAALWGFFAGMTYATKETCVIIFAALLGAALLNKVFFRAPENKPWSGKGKWRGHAAVFAGTGLSVVGMLYTSFFHNWRGPLDSLLSFGGYFERAGGAEWHVHPWYYYLKMLLFERTSRGPVWTEGVVLLLAVIGAAAAFRSPQDRSRDFFRFVTFYTILATLVFSLVPYKTPWNLLPFYLGMILLAGSGSVWVLKAAKKRWIKTVVVYLLFINLCFLAYQSWRSNHRFYADPRNPYVYSQTSPDFMRLVQRIQDLAPLHSQGLKMPIKVIADPYSTWPLPWYLRFYPFVGYWQDWKNAGGWEGIPLIIVSPDQLEKLDLVLDGRYQVEFYGLRPETLLALCIESDLWKAFIQTRK
jgi:uncharacterized protein (TIGR03663 family)